MSGYLLDTNTVSLFVRDRASAQLRGRLNRLPVNVVQVSAVSRGEILFGLVKAGKPPRLGHAVDTFFHTVTVLPWGEDEVAAYAELRFACTSQGITIAPLDLMIAAQALAAGAVLVTNDSALKRLAPWLPVEDWTL